MIEPDLINKKEKKTPLFIRNNYFKYQLQLQQFINISKRLFHSLRGRMLDDYLEHYKGNTKEKVALKILNTKNQFGTLSIILLICYCMRIHLVS